MHEHNFSNLAHGIGLHTRPLQTMEVTVSSDAGSFRELPQLGAIWLRNAAAFSTAPR